MGRWAQSKRRGGHHPGAADFPLGAPATDDWSLTDAATGGFANLEVFTTTLGEDGFLVKYSVVGPPITLTPDNPYADLANLTLPIEGSSGTGHVSAQIAWSLGGVQVSDWSEIKTTTTT